MNRTGIEYLTHSWNPIAMRCTPVSDGCTNCWHRRMADRLAGNERFPEAVRKAYAGEGPPVLVGDRLMKPPRCKKPARIGTQLMGDLFHDKVIDSFIEGVFDIMIGSPQHTFLVLTKRPLRMYHCVKTYFPSLANAKHIWLGVSIENQKAANERIPLLSKTPAALRFISCEPLLEPIHLRRKCPGRMHDLLWWIDWVIVGGESGLGARPMHPQWAKDIRDQCQTSGISYFHKQNGAWLGIDQVDHLLLPRQTWADITPHLGPPKEFVFEDGTICVRLGKKFSGRLLDGREWNEFPDVVNRKGMA